MNLSCVKITNLVSLGTIWALTRFSLYFLCSVTSYKSGHWNWRETYTQNILNCNLASRGFDCVKTLSAQGVSLGTIWALTRFSLYFLCSVTIYKSARKIGGRHTPYFTREANHDHT
jgi:hypothetical protein